MDNETREAIDAIRQTLDDLDSKQTNLRAIVGVLLDVLSEKDILVSGRFKSRYAAQLAKLAKTNKSAEKPKTKQ